MIPSPEKLRILIVDDEPGALRNLGDIFEDQDYIVTTAATGREAREAIRTHEFDVALLDIRLPDARGTDLLREIRQQSDLTRCIMVTASPDAEDAISALNDGASAYIQKPIKVAVVMRKIEEVVAKYRRTMEERRKLQDLDIVGNVGAVSMDLDMHRMLNNVLAEVVNGFQSDGGAVLLRPPGEDKLVGAAALSCCDFPVTDWWVPVGDKFVGRVASLRRTLALEDVTITEYEPSEYILRSGFVSLLGAPILSPKGVLGVIVLGWRNPRAFTRADLNLLSVLAQRLGLATSNATLYAQEDALKQRAEYLARVSQELNSRIADVRDVVDLVARLATERLGDGCAIFLSQPDSDILSGLVSYHRDPVKQKMLEERLRDQPIHMGEGIVGQVAASGRSMMATPQSIAAAYPDRPYLRDTGIAGTLAVPLRSHGEVFGVMSCSVSEPHPPYDDETLRLAEEFANRAAVAIDNARLLREAQDKREELQSLFEMTQDVTRTLQESDVLASLLRYTKDLVMAHACCVATLDQHGALVISGQAGIAPDAAHDMVSRCFRAWLSPMVASGQPFDVQDLQAVEDAEIAAAARRHGLRSMLTVPLGLEGRAEGVLIALRHDVDPDLPSRRQLLSTMGGLASVAMTNARLYKRERTIAQRLQEWILETDLNEDLEGIEVARNYHAALNEANVGGDFFDLFRVGEDTYGIVIGDVSGKGLEAALHTQAVKHTLRAYALNASAYAPSAGTSPLYSNSPRDVLMRTNDAVCFMLPTDIFITLFYGVLDTRSRVLRYANAGHDAPLLLHGDGAVEMLDSTGRALGLLSGAKYDEAIVNLSAGDVMLLYTDGVTEARRNGTFLETEGVVELLRNHAGESAEEVVKGIYRDVETYTNTNLHDDIALLALRVP